MFSDIPSLRSELEARLEAALPAEWRIVTAITANSPTLVPVVYVEFTGLVSVMNGKPLPHGVLGAEVNIIVTDPKTNDDGEAAIEEHLVDVIAALDPHTDLFWDSATKERIPATGEWAWALRIVAFVSIHPEPAEAPAEPIEE